MPGRRRRRRRGRASPLTTSVRGPQQGEMPLDGGLRLWPVDAKVFENGMHKLGSKLALTFSHANLPLGEAGGDGLGGEIRGPVAFGGFELRDGLDVLAGLDR